METHLNSQKSLSHETEQQPLNKLQQHLCIRHREAGFDNPAIIYNPKEDTLMQRILEEGRPRHSTFPLYLFESEWILKKGRVLSLRTILSREELRRISLKQYYASSFYRQTTKTVRFLHNVIDTSLSYNFFYTKIIIPLTKPKQQ